MSGQDVVIVGADGREHVFPAGFDPKRAASIVKQATAPPREKGLATIGEQIDAKRNPIVDAGVGALKGVGNTVFGLGRLVHDYTPIGRISDAIQPGAFDRQPEELQPTNTAQKLGYYGEQMGEFMIPLSKVATLGKAGEVARAAAQTMIQSGHPLEAGASGAIAAVMPGGAAAQRASSALQASAEKSAAQALGATKEWAKSEATRIAPQMIQRGVKGSRAAMLAQAKTAAQTVGADLNAAYTAAAANGDTVHGPIVRGALELTRDALKVKNASGALTVIPGTERVIQKLDDLSAFVQTLGDDIPVDRAAHVKRTMDKIVSKAGLFGPKATASATDNADAWAIREASGALRDLLNRNPTIAELNGELSFWTGLKNVLKETEKRTQAQRGGLTDAIRGTGGAVIGAAAGGPLGAGAGQLAAQQLSKVVESPAFKTTVSAPLKSALADALASGHAGQVLSVLKKISAALPGQMQPATAQ